MNKNIFQAARILEQGGVICFPTETVYALAANALDSSAINRIYSLKGRDFNKPLAILAKSKLDVANMTITDDRFDKLYDNFSPGPISYILPKKETFILPGDSNYRLSSLAVRVPDHAIAMQILNEANCPVVATSANISGDEEATDENSVRSIFSGKVDLIVGGDKSKIGIASTIVDLCAEQIKILRVGSISEDEIIQAIKG